MKNIKKSNVSSGFEYEIAELLENCETITGHKREVGEGALSTIQKQKMTVDEFKEAINKFLKRKVK